MDGKRRTSLAEDFCNVLHCCRYMSDEYARSSLLETGSWSSKVTSHVHAEDEAQMQNWWRKIGKRLKIHLASIGLTT